METTHDIQRVERVDDLFIRRIRLFVASLARWREVTAALPASPGVTPDFPIAIRGREQMPSFPRVSRTHGADLSRRARRQSAVGSRGSRKARKTRVLARIAGRSFPAGCCPSSSRDTRYNFVLPDTSVSALKLGSERANVDRCVDPDNKQRGCAKLYVRKLSWRLNRAIYEDSGGTNPGLSQGRSPSRETREDGATPVSSSPLVVAPASEAGDAAQWEESRSNLVRLIEWSVTRL